MDQRFRQQVENSPLPEHIASFPTLDNPLAQQREQRYRVARQRHTRRTILLGTTGGALCVAACILLIAVLTINGVLFASSANLGYPSIDGVSCQEGEMVAHHFHVHVTLYIDGVLFPVPADIGIAGVTPKDIYPQPICFYWLHTHDTSGLIHIESPTSKLFTLGAFLDIWSQKFPHASASSFPTVFNQAGWNIYINGALQPLIPHLRDILLKPHLLLTLAYHSPGVYPDMQYNWGSY